tara:strand:+ start:1252 stop:2547 length:1296 start_codon:yes stop_codon:yes gene_type:complete
MENKLELYSQEAEQAILGSLMMNNDYLLGMDFLEAKHFYFKDHQLIFERIITAIASSRADQITLKAFFVERIENGLSYMSTLFGQASGVIDLKDYARLIVDFWQKRQLQESLQKINFSDDFLTIRDSLDDQLIDYGFESSKQPQHISKLVDKVIDDPKGELLFFDFENLDGLTGGVELSDLIILGGLPSSGKTTLCLNLARNISKKGGVIFFSIEVKDSSLARKFLSELASVNPFRIKQGNLNQGEHSSLDRSRKDTANYQLMIDDESGMTISKMRSKIKRIKRKMDIKMICIDYLQLMTPQKKEFSREQEVSKIVEGLKKIAKDFNIVVVALSQLSRAVHGRENKRPILSDLRDSGAVEANADIVMFVHRDEYFLERSREPEGSKNYKEWLSLYEASKSRADVILAKQRNGQLGDCQFHFDGLFSRFTQL